MNLIQMDNNFDKIKGSMIYNFLKENIVSSYYNFSNNDDLNNFDFTSSKKYNFTPKKFCFYKNLLNQLMSLQIFLFLYILLNKFIKLQF